MVLPFWDVDACLAEIDRCAAKGHRGIVFAQNFDKVGQPPLSSGHWDRIFDKAQGMQLPINFHVGFGAWGSTEDFEKTLSNTTEFDRRTHARDFVMFMAGNARGIAEVVINGVAEKFPRLDFVSIESGFGFIPYLHAGARLAVAQRRPGRRTSRTACCRASCSSVRCTARSGSRRSFPSTSRRWSTT